MAAPQPTRPETWRPVKGYEGIYEVSDQGRVRSVTRRITYKDGRSYIRRGQPMTQTRSNGYHYTVRLSKNRKSRNEYVHVLVAETFIRPRIDGEYVLHWNDDPSDNRVENLRLGTQSNNMYDLVRNGNHYWAKRTHCKHGHEYTPENIYWMSCGARKCRQCKRQQSREHARRARERLIGRGIA